MASSEDQETGGESLLIQRIREGEEYAFEIAFLKYHTPLCRYIRKYVRSKHLSEEIIQEVFTEVWKERKRLNPSGHLRGYLFDVARHKALDYIKHQKIVRDYLSEAKRQKEQRGYENIHGTEDSYTDLEEAIQELVSHLPSRGRHIYKLSREEGLTYKEISEYLDISEKTVETHMRRTLKKLRAGLSEFLPTFFIVEIFLCFYQILSQMG